MSSFATVLRSARCLRGVVCGAFLVAAALASPNAPAQAADQCEDPRKAIGLSRIVEIDAANGPLFGHATHFTREPNFLRPKEVVLTFDDGPVPWITRSILATLARHCTRATFFPVGRMAIAYPTVVREVLDHGHAVGSHTWSHPFRMPRMKKASALLEIDKGFAAVALAAGRPIAPFFRFPGLNDSPELLEHLAGRGAATFTVDVVSEDSYLDDADEIVRRTLERAAARNGGILLFHDIKPATARALPVILERLKERGFTVVHMVSRMPYRGPDTFDAELRPRLGKAIAHAEGVAAAEPESGLAHPLDGLKSKVPFFGAIPPVVIANPGLPVTTLVPERRQHQRRAGGKDATRKPALPVGLSEGPRPPPDSIPIDAAAGTAKTAGATPRRTP